MIILLAFGRMNASQGCVNMRHIRRMFTSLAKALLQLLYRLYGHSIGQLASIFESQFLLVCNVLAKLRRSALLSRFQLGELLWRIQRRPRRLNNYQ